MPDRRTGAAGRKLHRRPYDLEERLLEFTCKVTEVVESIVPSRTGNHVAGQLVRCGTSPLDHYAKAPSAESQRDFVHKLKIGLKELRETRVWLLVTQRRRLSRGPTLVDETLRECEELIRIFQSSIRTSERNARPVRETAR